MYGKIFLLLIPAALCAQWTPELSMKVKTVTAPVPSPDGRLTVWTETHPVMDGEKSEERRSGHQARLPMANEQIEAYNTDLHFRLSSTVSSILPAAIL